MLAAGAVPGIFEAKDFPLLTQIMAGHKGQSGGWRWLLLVAACCRLLLVAGCCRGGLGWTVGSRHATRGIFKDFGGETQDIVNSQVGSQVGLASRGLWPTRMVVDPSLLYEACGLPSSSHQPSLIEGCVLMIICQPNNSISRAVCTPVENMVDARENSIQQEAPLCRKQDRSARRFKHFNG